MAIAASGPPGTGPLPSRPAPRTMVGLESSHPSATVETLDGGLLPLTTDRSDPVTTGRLDTDEMVRQLVAAQELERRRIARDLHDVVGQALTAVKLNLEAMRRGSGTGMADTGLRRSIAIVDQAMSDLRDIAFDIRPAIIDDLGLVAATRWYLSRQARTVGYRSGFRADPIPSSIGMAIESACFRTLQEALTNVARHARATRVQVELRLRPDELVLVVDDDGVGFDLRRVRRHAGRHPTLGLIGTSERIALVGGSLDVASRPGHGTRILAHFPHRAPATEFEGPR